MRKFWLATALLGTLLFVFSIGASAQTFRAAVMDLSVVMTESEAGKAANAQLAQFIRQKQVEIDQLVAVVNGLEAELAGGLSNAEREAKQAALETAQADLDALVERAQAEINGRSEALRNQLLDDIGQVLNLIGQERDYTVILDSAAVFYYKLVVDITWEVVRRYDELYLAAVNAAESATQPSSN